MELATLTTPTNDGFYMPAEWGPHVRCWMAWPYSETIWRSEFDAAGVSHQPAKKVFAEVARAIARFEKVTVLALPQLVAEASFFLAEGSDSVVNPNISVLEMDYDDVWMRDCGPTFLLSKQSEGSDAQHKRAVKWRFNGWGEKAPFTKDDAVAASIAARADACTGTYIADFILEGGSIHVDGEGTVLTTEECLLHPSRNPGLSKQDIEARLLQFLGARKVIWLPEGLTDDEDTNGHVDNMAAFSRPGRVLLAWSDDPTDPQFHRCRSAEAALRACGGDASGRLLEVVRLPVPARMHYTRAECGLRGDADADGAGDGGGGSSGGGSEGAASAGSSSDPFRRPGARLAASYVNFYLAGTGGVVVPGFGDAAADAAAVAILAAEFPGRTVVQVGGAREILLGGGNIHCITQQEPQAQPAA